MLYSLTRLFFILFTFAAIITSATQNVITVPEGHLGILKERTGGFKKPFLKPGFHWRWAAFVPEKYTIYLIKLNPDAVSIHFNQGLKYAKILGLSDLLSVKIELEIEYSLSEEIIDQLLSQFSEDIFDWSNIIKRRTELMLEAKFTELYQGSSDLTGLHKKFYDYIQKEFKSDWATAFAAEKITLTKVRLKNIDVPEKEIYENQIKNIKEVFGAKRKVMINKILAESEIYTQSRLDQTSLEKAKEFASLIEANPKILEFIKIDKLHPKVKVMLLEQAERNNIQLNDEITRQLNTTEEEAK